MEASAQSKIKNANRKEALGTEPVGKLLFQLALPAITAQVVNLLYNLVDRMYIGHIKEVGHLALTGVGVCMTVILLVSAFAALAGMGGAPRASILMGKKQYRQAEEILGNCTALLILLAVILTAVILRFAEPMLLFFGASENTVGYGVQYLQVYAIGTIFVQMTLGLNMFISAQGFAKISMMTTLIGAVINIVLDPVFIFLFHMGVRGAALATILSQAVSAIWVLLFLTGEKTGLRLRLKNIRLSPRVIGPCILLGLSPFVMQSTESLINICFNRSLLSYGDDLAVGAMVILSSVMQFSMMPLQGLSQGAQPITGYNYGAGNAQRVKAVFRLLLICSLIYSLSIWCICMFLPQLVAMLFADNRELIDYSVWAMRIYMAASGIFGIQIACQQTFIAIGNAKTSLFLAVFRKILLLIPLIYILPHFLEDKVFAVFLAEPVADAIAVCTTATLFFIQFRRAMAKLAAQNEAKAQNAEENLA